MSAQRDDEAGRFRYRLFGRGEQTRLVSDQTEDFSDLMTASGCPAVPEPVEFGAPSEFDIDVVSEAFRRFSSPSDDECDFLDEGPTDVTPLSAPTTEVDADAPARARRAEVLLGALPVDAELPSAPLAGAPERAFRRLPRPLSIRLSRLLPPTGEGDVFA